MRGAVRIQKEDCEERRRTEYVLPCGCSHNLDSENAKNERQETHKKHETYNQLNVSDFVELVSEGR